MARWSKFFLDALRLVKPKYHNRLAWVVVIAGLGLVSTGILEKLVNLFLKARYNLTLTDETDSYIGLALVLIGLGYHLWMQKIIGGLERAEAEVNFKERIEHDRKLFAEADGILAESKLFGLLDCIGADHSYCVSWTSDYIELCEFLGQRSNRFLDEALREAAAGLKHSMDDLHTFIGKNFFDYDKDRYSEDLRMCLQPEWNVDRAGSGTPEERQKYDALGDKLAELIKRVEVEYAGYRDAVKETLAV